MHCYLEVAETNSVEIPKVFLADNQVRDELVNVNKMPTKLKGSVVESAFFGVFSQKKKLLDCYIYGELSYNKQEITESKLTRSRFVTSMLLCTFPANLQGQ